MRGLICHSRLLVLGALIVGAVLCAPARGAEKATVENPHWKKDGCATCHDMSTGKAAPIVQDKIDKLCLSCHDGKKAVAEVHPIHRKFKAADNMVRPENWPAINDEVGCITCHDSQFACDLAAHSPAANRRFLRGRPEGTGRTRPFCQNCHQEEAYRKINPHLMLGGNGEILEERCLVCHDKALDRKTVHRTFEPGLKAEEAVVCRDCHGPHKDRITQGHIGRQIKADQQAYIAAKEALGLCSNPSKELIGKFQAAGKVPKFIVPAKDGNILCSTCHNPHQHGVFAEDSDMAYGAMRIDGRGRIVSPVREPIWCRHCHPM
ncbi:MAG: cytochrome c3 family protein [Tepidisphaerales bacterium]